MKKFLPLALLIGILACVSVNAPSPVEAVVWSSVDWRSSWNSGYSMTTNYQGIIVPIPTDVEAYAGTVRPSEANQVVFRWIHPDGLEELSGPHPLLDTGELANGNPIYAASNPHLIDQVGNWGVQALFYKDGALVTTFPPNNGVEAIRAASFFSVPEVPLGTITATLTMMATLAVIALRNRSNRTLTVPTI